MKKLQLKSRKLLRTLFGCLSFTAVAFVFQACYGTGPDPFYDVKFTGTVQSKHTKLPVKGIKIVVNDEKFGSGFTDKNGNFDFYASVPNYEDYYRNGNLFTFLKPDSVMVYFLDIDSIENGSFEDEIYIVNPAHKDEVKIHVELEEKQ
jgi:hypothetical protein